MDTNNSTSHIAPPKGEATNGVVAESQVPNTDSDPAATAPVEASPIDLTSSHLKEFVDEEGRRHLVIKPLKIEHIPNDQGGVDVRIHVPTMKAKIQINPS